MVPKNYVRRQGGAVQDAVKRVNVGGKLLTNFLKETISYRQVRHVVDVLTRSHNNS
jgi:hypothetical protein